MGGPVRCSAEFYGTGSYVVATFGSNRRSAGDMPTIDSVTASTTTPSGFGLNAFGYPSCRARAGLARAMRQVG